MLLLARTAGAWRTECVLELGPLEPALEGRADARWQAVTSLAVGISQLDLPDYRGIDLNQPGRAPVGPSPSPKLL
jgi:hypothetical protein